MEMTTINIGDYESLWPTIEYEVHMRNFDLHAELNDPDQYIRFLALREPNVREDHLRTPEMGFRALEWHKEYRSLLTGDDLRAYVDLLTEDWTRIAVARNIGHRWDSYWRKSQTDPRGGTLLFTRSSSGEILCEIDVHFSQDYVIMYTDQLRVTLEAQYDEDYDKKMANWLLMTQFWTIPMYPFPAHSTDDQATRGITAFILGGKNVVLTSVEAPDNADTYQIVRRIQENASTPYVRLWIMNEQR